MNQTETNTNASKTDVNALSTANLLRGGIFGLTDTQQGLTEPQIHLLADAPLRYAPREVHHRDGIGDGSGGGDRKRLDLSPYSLPPLTHTTH